MRPIIGVMPLWDEEKDSIWMLPGYMDGIIQAGGTPIIFPFNIDEEEIHRLTSMCDGILITGGQDVDPAIYSEEVLDDTVGLCEMRDRLELKVLQIALAEDKPILGICRGLQLLNAALGGKLYQDLPQQHPSEVCHNQKAPFDAPIHEVRIPRDSPLYECAQTEELGVNSLHHQAISVLAPGCEAMAVSSDGLVEAFHVPDQKFVWAIQWHPEFLYKVDECSRRIFRKFVESMAQ